MLAIRNFLKKYSARLILSVPEIDFHPGIHWIKGDNGSGKSTFFRAIAGLCPFEGSIVLDHGLSCKKDPQGYLQRLTYSEAEPLFPGFLTPKDLFTFVGKARKSPPEELEYYRKIFGIHEYNSSPFETCSSGMIKKVSLALSFLGSPQLIILDEPFITLDHEAQQTLLNIMKEWSEKHKTIFLLSSHQWSADGELPLSSIHMISNKTLQRLEGY